MDPRGIIAAAFDRPKVAMLFMVVLCVIGLSTYRNAPREADPDIPLPFVQVVLPLPGVSPEDAERLLLRPTETEINSLEGLVEVNSTARDGFAEMSLEFEPGADMEQVLVDVREAVDAAKADFPDEAQEPIIEELNAQQMFPVVTVVLSGTAPERALYRAAKGLEDRLLAVPGVLEVNLVGARDEQVEILISPETMQNYGLTVGEVANALSQNNTLVTAGRLQFDDGSYTVKVPGLLKETLDLASIPIRADLNNLITLGDIADIRRGFADPEGFAQFNGQQAIGVDVVKRSTANLIDVTEGVKTAALSEAEGWASTIEVDFIGDQSTQVESIFFSLTSSIMLAIILVMIVMVAALGLRSALLVGIAVPSAFLIGLCFIGIMGFTLNQLVMFSMVLAVGMLVDGAIVIVELADRRMSEGAGRREAFYEAARRMFWPIVASTATTLAAFVPFLFWDAIEGYFMRWIPITLIMVLSASLLVALIFLPLIGAAFAIPTPLKRRFHLKGQAEGRENVDLDNVDPTRLPGMTGAYARLIDRLVKSPVVVLAVALIGVMLCGKIFSAADPDVEQFIKVDSEQVMVIVQGRGNLSETEILEVSREVQDRLLGHPAIEFAYLQTGPQVSRGNDAPPESIARITLDLVPYAERESSLILSDTFREMTSDVPGVVIEVRQPEAGPAVGKDVQVELVAPQPADALMAAEVVRAFMEESHTSVNGVEVPTFMDIEDTRPLPGIEWALRIDRAEAGRYGLSVSDVGYAVQMVTRGVLIDTFRPDDADEELDIRLRFPSDARSIDQLTAIQIPTQQGDVPLANFVERVPQQQVDRIVRRDGRRIMEIKANGSTNVPGHEVSQDRATEVMQEWLDEGGLDNVAPGLTWRLRGAAEERDKSVAFLQGAMLAAMALIGVILLMQFNSFYHSALTLSAVVLSVFGVLLGVALSGQYISTIMTGVGIVALAGIVVNNNIVLIDTYQNLRLTGLGVQEAAVRTASQRLRPVLLTTITTIVGLLPMVFEIDIDFANATVGIGNETSAWWVLLSSAIVYGLAFSTLLTLVLTPVLLAAPTVIGERIKTAIAKYRPQSATSPSDTARDISDPALPRAAE